MKGIKIWTNIKMQTGIKYIPALGSFMVRDYFKADRTLKEEYQCSKCGRKIKLDNYEKNEKKGVILYGGL